MHSRVSFIPVCDSLEKLSIEKKCSFCGVFTEKSQNSLCFGCQKAIQNIKEDEIYLISYKPYWLYLADQKDAYNLSWFDFLELENIILEELNVLNSVFYDKNNFFYYLDLNYLSLATNKVCEVFSKINEIINKEMINNEIDKKLNHNFNEIFSNIENINASNRFIYLVTEDCKKNVNPVHFFYDRKKLMSKLREKFEFNILQTYN
jgi:hypothetical protein